MPNKALFVQKANRRLFFLNNAERMITLQIADADRMALDYKNVELIKQLLIDINSNFRKQNKEPLIQHHTKFEDCKVIVDMREEEEGKNGEIRVFSSIGDYEKVEQQAYTAG